MKYNEGTRRQSCDNLITQPQYYKKKDQVTYEKVEHREEVVYHFMTTTGVMKRPTSATQVKPTTRFSSASLQLWKKQRSL